MDTRPTSPPATNPAREEVWPKWRVRLARLSPYAIEISDQLHRLRRLTQALTIIPAFMGSIVFVLLTIFGRPDIGALAVIVIFGPMIALAWWDYLRIAKQARSFMESQRIESIREPKDRN